jgi:deoxycytidylate deaminase
VEKETALLPSILDVAYIDTRYDLDRVPFSHPSRAVMSSKPEQIADPIETFDYPNAEIVIGLACAVGTEYGPIRDFLVETLLRYGYKPKVVRISDSIPKFTDYPLQDSPEIERIDSRMTAGNLVCCESGRNDIWALAAIAAINSSREQEQVCENFHLQKPLPRTANILLTLKRPEEVRTLRKVYGDGFFLIGLFATYKERLDYLIQQNAPRQQAIDLINRDAAEEDPHGQQTRKTFYLSDVFVSLRDQAYRGELERFFDLVFSDPLTTPTQHENAMFLAYASSLRSGQLGRQVGAAIASKGGDIIALGCNDVPKPGGGLYWPGKDDGRDGVLGFDTNDKQRDKIVDLLVSRLPRELRESSEKQFRSSFREILDITEYGRAVHAEMDALLCSARSGVSPVGANLYTTTFPCHNCTRHIIAAGIERVFYIEPYAKSRAEELHEDAIIVEEKGREDKQFRKRRVPFTPFVGVGPRRYFDLFSLTLSRGYEVDRKKEGRTIKFSRQGAFPRVPMSPFSYIQKEAIAIKELDSLPKQLEIFE